MVGGYIAENYGTFARCPECLKSDQGAFFIRFIAAILRNVKSWGNLYCAAQPLGAFLH